MFRGSGRTQESGAEVLAVSDVDLKLRRIPVPPACFPEPTLRPPGEIGHELEPASEVAGDGYTFELGLRPFECFLDRSISLTR
jgi:hypothetical protein